MTRCSLQVLVDRLGHLKHVQFLTAKNRLYLGTVKSSTALEHSDVVILKDDYVSIRRYFQAIQVSGPNSMR